MRHLGHRHDGGRGVGPARRHPHVQVAFVQMIGKGGVEPAQLDQRIAAKGAVGSQRADGTPAFGCQKADRITPGLNRHGQAVAGHPFGPHLPAQPVAPARGPGRSRQAGIGERRGQAGQPRRLGHRVVVDEGHDLARRRHDPGVAGGRDVGRVETHPLDRQVRAHADRPGVGDQHDFEPGMVLKCERGQAQRQRRGTVARDDDDADAADDAADDTDCRRARVRLRQSSPMRRIIASIRGTSSGLFNSQNSRPRA